MRDEHIARLLHKNVKSVAPPPAETARSAGYDPALDAIIEEVEARWKEWKAQPVKEGRFDDGTGPATVYFRLLRAIPLLGGWQETAEHDAAFLLPVARLTRSTWVRSGALAALKTLLQLHSLTPETRTQITQEISTAKHLTGDN